MSIRDSLLMDECSVYGDFKCLESSKNQEYFWATLQDIKVHGTAERQVVYWQLIVPEHTQKLHQTDEVMQMLRRLKPSLPLLHLSSKAKLSS